MRTLLLASAVACLSDSAFAQTESVQDMKMAITPADQEALAVEWTLVITSDIYRGGSVDFFPATLTKAACLRVAEFGPDVFEGTVGGSDFGGACVNNRTGEVAIPE